MSKLFDDASLAMIPSAYKDGKLYSIRPTDGSGDFTFSRGSNLAATRVDVNGLIEKGRENLLLQSNQFDTTPWALANTTITSGQTGYDGSSDAWLLEVATTGNARRVQQTHSSSGLQIFSVYVKAGTTDWIILYAGGLGGRYFNVSTGAQGTTFGGTPLISNIEAIGATGYYRCSIVVNGTNTGSFIYPVDNDGSPNGTAGANIYIQDAQLEQGLVATDYIETGTSAAQSGILEDMPRLDYSGGASCPSLLLEPQRTNEIIFSEYFGSSEWIKRTSDGTAAPVVTDNYAVSPEGVQNASRVVVTKPSTDNDYAVINDNKGIVKSAGDTFTSSVYLKATDASQVGKIVDIYTFESGGGYKAVKSHTLTNDWVRLDSDDSFSGSTGDVELLNIGKARSSAGGTTLENMATDFLIYGAQFELGSYPTSYIPTYGTSQTRSYDNPFLANVSSLIGQTQGSVLVELTRDALESYTQRVVTLSDGTSNNTIGLQLTAANSFSYYVTKDGVLQGLVTKTDATTANQKVKVAFAYAENDFVMYVDGVLAGIDTSGSIPAVNTIKFQRESNGLHYVGLINQLSVFPTRLTNAELAALTTI